MTILTGRLSYLTSTSARSLNKPIHLEPAGNIAKLPCLPVRRAIWHTRTGHKTTQPIKEQSSKIVTSNIKQRSKFSLLSEAVFAGASVVGMGCLCYFTLKDIVPGKNILLSVEMKKRITDTYMYFGGGMIITSLSALVTARSAALMTFFRGRGWLSLLPMGGIVYAHGYVCHSLQYREGIGAKQLMWIGQSIIMGTLIAPLAAIGGGLVLNVAFYSAGIILGLAFQCLCAKGDFYIVIGCPLAMTLNYTLFRAVAHWFLPPPYTGLRAIFMTIAVIGGLIGFASFLMTETLRILNEADRKDPETGRGSYDPINNSIGIYLNGMKVLYKIAMILIQE